VRQAVLVCRLALRELWISFRLLLLLAVYVAAGTVAAVVPAPLPTTLFRLAVGLAAAGVTAAVIAAWSLSRERALGRAAWLATHSIPRATILIGWFVPLAAVSVLGLLAAGSLGWLATSASSARPGALAFAATVASIATLVMALLALGLLVGALVRAPAAALVTALACALIVAVPWAAVPPVTLPIEALARLPELAAPTSLAVQGAGAGLLATAVLLIVARGALGRVDL